MITRLFEQLSADILAQAKWLTEIRSVGHLVEVEGERSTVAESASDLREIGLTDTRLISGYIRFRADQNFSVTEGRNIATGLRNYQFSIPARLVVCGEEFNSLDISLLLTRYLRSWEKIEWMEFANVRAVVVGGGSNTIKNYQNETKKEIENVSIRVTYVDFNLVFEDRQICDFDLNIDLPMNCKCTNVLDLGCVKSCDEIEIPIPSQDSVMKTVFNGSVIQRNIEGEPSGNIVIDAGTLNEDYTFDLSFFDENAEQLTAEVNEVVYDCFRIKIMP